MKNVYKFVAGNSRAAPAGIALAIGISLPARHAGGWTPAVVYLLVLVLTLAASTLEPVQ
ncbi:MAG TPA: hypothetical protein VGZ02_01155 [Candidatus Baltobacteraceae bacterium]|jgi:hypothetical protein|nr:hypothetical protein [Candidatus Baltobacteraceae bacterium]